MLACRVLGFCGCVMLATAIATTTNTISFPVRWYCENSCPGTLTKSRSESPCGSGIGWMRKLRFSPGRPTHYCCEYGGYFAEDFTIHAIAIEAVGEPTRRSLICSLPITFLIVSSELAIHSALD